MSSGPFESARVRVDGDGRVVCHSGAPSQGQGHETAFAQILADQLGVRLEDVTILSADTAAVPMGVGTFGSRGLATGGGAVAEAGRRVREKVLRIAAQRLEASPGDLELREGRIQVRGAPSRAIAFAEVARIANQQPGSLPAGMDPGIEETAYFRPEGPAYANGANACVVEVDPATGAVRVLRHVIVHDCGRVINPLLVEGQIHGGEMYGLAMALLEELVHDEAGQLLTASFMDYLLPSATEVPRYEIEHMESPTPLNPIGAKGAGEGGTIPAPAALASAVEDALAPFGARIRELPMSPPRLRALVERPGGGRGA
jgi:carbon-monoxide dehydrogenase large subunit